MRTIRVLALVMLGCFLAGEPASAGDGLGTWQAIGVAGIAFLGAVVSAVASLLLARLEARRIVETEYTRRQAELALRISDKTFDPDEGVRKAAMRRYAVAIVKVVSPASHPECGTVHFIPMNTRVTVGRAEDNDIVLKDEAASLSRWHCGFIANQRYVWIDDFHSRNGTMVNGSAISSSVRLGDNAEIEVGEYTLHFRLVRENTVLSQ